MWWCNTTGEIIDKIFFQIAQILMIDLTFQNQFSTFLATKRLQSRHYKTKQSQKAKKLLKQLSEKKIKFKNIDRCKIDECQI